MLNTIIIILALCLLILSAYRNYSIIIFAPLAIILALMFTDLKLVLPIFSNIFMVKTAEFIQLYLPIFILGALFGKMMEISGLSKSIAFAIINLIGAKRSILAVVLICSTLTYGGVSSFVAAFAVYPFANELFHSGNVPKRLMPGTIILGILTFTMVSLPGSPQIQNIIPSSFFHTTTWSAPILGIWDSVFVFTLGWGYLEYRYKSSLKNNEGYGAKDETQNLPVNLQLSHPVAAILPIIIVILANLVLIKLIPFYYGKQFTFLAGNNKYILDIGKNIAIWAVEIALMLGILSIFCISYRKVVRNFTGHSKTAVSGALLAILAAAMGYGFGSVIAILPGFIAVTDMLKYITNPLLKEAVTITSLSAIMGSSAGALSVGLGMFANNFMTLAQSMHIPMEVLHRVAAMASGGMDTLPHNSVIITLLIVTGISYKESYKDIFVLTIIKTAMIFVIIALYYLTGWY